VYPYPPSPPRGGEAAVDDSGDSLSKGVDGRGVKVYVRKRPIHPEELDAEEFDVISCDKRTVTLHDARMHSDMQRQIMRHHAFTFDGVFHEGVGNNDVFDTAVARLIPEACGGKVATAMAYGQTGSGKTFTMTSVYHRAAAELFDELGDDASAQLSLVFLEVTNTKASDLFGEGRSVKLVDGIAVGATEVPVTSADEMMEFVQFGNRVRRTEETGVHAASSRSHSVLQVHVRRAEAAAEGCLVLVDLAGSEQAIDSAYHNAQRQKEGAAINSSLSALKGCIRARAAGSDAQFHFRKSALTMALKASFTSLGAKTVIIATASPASKDTEHTLNTLRHACIMHGDGKVLDANIDVSKGGSITTVQLGRIDVRAEYLRNKEEQKEAARKGSCTFGTDAVRSNGNEKAGGYGVALSTKEIERQQRRAERAALRRLHPACVERLLAARQDNATRMTRQFDRVRRARDLRIGTDDRSASRRSSARKSHAPSHCEHEGAASAAAPDEVGPRRHSQQHAARAADDSGGSRRRSSGVDSGRVDKAPLRKSDHRSGTGRKHSAVDDSHGERKSERGVLEKPRRRQSTRLGEPGPMSVCVQPNKKNSARGSRASSASSYSSDSAWQNDYQSVDAGAALDDVPAAPVVSMQKQKAEAVKARRQAALAAKLARKQAKTVAKSSRSADEEIARLEDSIATASSGATAAGLRRRLAALKAAKIRKQRKRESEARAAAVAATEAAEEAAQQRASPTAVAAAQPPPISPVFSSRASPRAWSDDDESDASDASGLRITVHHRQSPDRQSKRGSAPLQPLHGSPVLARKWGSSGTVELAPSSRRSPPRGYGRRSSTPRYDAYGRLQPVGAASAPWGNEYTADPIGAAAAPWGNDYSTEYA